MAPLAHTLRYLIGLVTLLVLSFAVQIGAEPITTFKSEYHFRWNIGPNSVGLPPGDRQFVGILEVAPTAGTTVTATQGAVTRPLPFTPSTAFPKVFRSLQPFDPALTGSWSITATNGPDMAGPLLTPPIANPQLLPFAENLQVVGTGRTPTVTWTLPDLTGINLAYLRFRVYNDLDDDLIYNTQISKATIAFPIPSGLLFPGVPYIFSVSLHDTDGNVSTAFTQSAYFIPAPLQLLVSSELTDSVKRYNAETGEYLGEFVSAGVNGQVKPRALTYGPDGHLYVGGGGDGNPNVKRFDGKSGAPLGTVTSGYPPRINGLTFGPDGYLYGAVFEGNSVFRVDVTAKTKLGEIGAGSPLDGPTGVAFGADGNLYVGSWYTGQVLRFDGTTGAYIDVFATLPPGGSTSAVTFGPHGDLYVAVEFCGPAGCLSGDIWRFDGTTGISKGSFIPPADPHPVEPLFQVFGPDGNLYVTSHETDQVLRYDGTSGAFIGSVVIGGGLNGPSGIAFRPRPPVSPNDLLVASYNTSSVKRYDGATGAYLGDFVDAGGQANPRGMSFGPDGNLYVGGSSWGAPGSIRRFDGTTGAFLGTVTSGHPGPIGGVIFGPDDDLYSPVFLQDYVIHVDPSTGELRGTIGPGSPLDDPSGLAFGADGNLYVGSYPDNQVLRFDGTTGAFIDVFATVPIAGNPGHVADVIFDPDGDLLVTIGYAEPTGNIWRFDGTTGASLGAFIPESDPHPAIPVFLVFGPDGNLYVGSSPDQVFRYDGTTGAFIDVFASGGGLDGPFGLAFVPEPGAATQLGAGLLALVALARRRSRGSRSRRNAQGTGKTRARMVARAQA